MEQDETMGQARSQNQDQTALFILAKFRQKVKLKIEN
jgi:hypothetical protein